MNELNNNIINKLEEDLLRKRIMKKVYMRWLLFRKLPQVLGEIGIITFLVIFAQSRVSFVSVFKNAYAAGMSDPLGIVHFSLAALSHTTPSVKMLTALLAVLAVMIIRDIQATRKYNPLSVQ